MRTPLTFSLSLLICILSYAQKMMLVLKQISVVDVVSGKVTRDRTVEISGNRITSIEKKTAIPSNATVVDGRGKYLIPGLWDMHVHIFEHMLRPGANDAATYFPLFLANGVTGIRNMWTDLEDFKVVREWRSEVESGKLLAPRVIAGRLIDGIPTYLPNMFGVSTPEDARRAVQASKDSGADFIKVYWNLSRECYFAIADESKRLGIPFEGHTPFALDAREASNAGQRSIEHFTGILEACSPKNEELRKRPDYLSPGVTDELWRTIDEKKCLDVFALLAKNKTWICPTLALGNKLLLDSQHLENDPLLRYIPTFKMNSWLKAIEKKPTPERLEVRKQRNQKHLEWVAAMNKMGVPMLAGTDLTNPFLVAGFSLHEELEVFVQAGMTPIEALRTATINPAVFLGLTDSLGSIEKGKIADLVLLDANPLDNISNTRKIAGVIINGTYLSKPDLDKLLAEAETAAKRN